MIIVIDAEPLELVEEAGAKNDHIYIGIIYLMIK